MLPQSWYEPDVEPDFPYVDEETYYQLKDDFDEATKTIDDAEMLVYQLICELYDDCKNVDKEIVHDIIVKLCNAVEVFPPEIKHLKI